MTRFQAGKSSPLGSAEVEVEVEELMLVKRARLEASGRDMMGRAVPERRKSASLAELMKLSWKVAG